MDVTPGPQLCRRITVLGEKLDQFRYQHSEWLTNDDLPTPDFMSWAQDFAGEIELILPLVRS